jgi:hypothetical protein
MNFNVALESAPELTILNKFPSPKLTSACLANFFICRITSAGASGRITEHDGKMALFIRELQCDLCRLEVPHVAKLIGS